MKKSILTIFCIILSQYATANENFGWYFGLSSTADVQYKEINQNGWLSGNVGFRHPNGWRTELEIGQRNASFNGHAFEAYDTGYRVEDVYVKYTDKFSSWTFMGNVIYDIGDICYGISPYVGAGIGIEALESDIAYQIKTIDEEVGEKLHLKRSGYAYQIITGIAYPIYDQNEFSIDYKFLASIDKDYPISVSDRNAIHSVSLGVKRFF